MEAPSRALVVVNPVSGSEEVRRHALARCEALLEEVQVIESGPDGETVRAVERVAAGPEPPDLVVVAGGDGTVREAAEGIARGLGCWPPDANDLGATAGEPPTALVVAPAGRGNSAYKSLWGDTAWEDALERSLKGDGGVRLRGLDLLRVAELDRGTLLGVNCGLIARIAAVTARLPGDAGEDRYWGAVADALQNVRDDPIRVLVDGELLLEGPSTLVTVGGVRRFGGGAFELLPRAELDDGLLDVCAVAALDESGLQDLAAKVPSGTHLDHPGVRYRQGITASVERTDGEPLAFEHDGDAYDVGRRITLELVPGACPVLAAG